MTQDSQLHDRFVLVIRNPPNCVFRWLSHFAYGYNDHSLHLFFASLLPESKTSWGLRIQSSIGAISENHAAILPFISHADVLTVYSMYIHAICMSFTGRRV